MQHLLIKLCVAIGMGIDPAKLKKVVHDQRDQADKVEPHRAEEHARNALDMILIIDAAVAERDAFRPKTLGDVKLFG